MQKLKDFLRGGYLAQVIQIANNDESSVKALAKVFKQRNKRVKSKGLEEKIILAAKQLHKQLYQGN
jgi:hypothetical protein